LSAIFRASHGLSAGETRAALSCLQERGFPDFTSLDPGEYASYGVLTSFLLKNGSG
jgi:hypothetical protein